MTPAHGAYGADNTRSWSHTANDDSRAAEPHRDRTPPHGERGLISSRKAGAEAGTCLTTGSRLTPDTAHHPLPRTDRAGVKSPRLVVSSPVSSRANNSLGLEETRDRWEAVYQITSDENNQKSPLPYSISLNA